MNPSITTSLFVGLLLAVGCGSQSNNDTNNGTNNDTNNGTAGTNNGTTGGTNNNGTNSALDGDTVEIGDDWTEPGCLENVNNVNPDPNYPDYLFTGIVDVTADLCIQPGVTIAFESGSRLFIKPEGSLTAIGTAALPIVFRGRDSTPGIWGPVIFQSNSQMNQLEHVTISGSGAYKVPGEIIGSVIIGPLGDPSQVAMRNVTITNGVGAGIVVTEDDGKLSEFTDNTISDVTGAPIEAWLGGLPALDVGNTLTGNGEDAIRIDLTEVSTDLTLTASPVPYRIGFGLDNSNARPLQVDAALTITEGALLEFEADFGLLINETGTLIVEGSAGNPVVFTKASDASVWNGIAIQSNVANSIDFASISETGGEWTSAAVSTNDDQRAAIYVGSRNGDPATLTLTNTTFENIEGSAMYRFDPASPITESDNTFNGTTPIVEH